MSKPANSQASARVAGDRDVVSQTTRRFFQALGTTDVPTNPEQVVTIVHGIHRRWLEKPDMMNTIAFRENGMLTCVNILARRDDAAAANALELIFRAIDALGEAPQRLQGRGEYDRAMRILNGMVPTPSPEADETKPAEDSASA
jgi:hypothetical protein